MTSTVIRPHWRGFGAIKHIVILYAVDLSAILSQPHSHCKYFNTVVTRIRPLGTIPGRHTHARKILSAWNFPVTPGHAMLKSPTGWGISSRSIARIRAYWCMTTQLEGIQYMASSIRSSIILCDRSRANQIGHHGQVTTRSLVCSHAIVIPQLCGSSLPLYQ